MIRCSGNRTIISLWNFLYNRYLQSQWRENIFADHHGIPFGNTRYYFKNPLFCGILGNTAYVHCSWCFRCGATPEKTLFTPVLDAELITWGAITSHPIKPDTPTGCPTPASITRAMMELCGIHRYLSMPVSVIRQQCLVLMYRYVGDDPRFRDAVPRAKDLVRKGEMIGKFLSKSSDLLVLGECVPGGTTTALCVMRALGYPASVSSSFVNNPVSIKEEICRISLGRIKADSNYITSRSYPLCGDPMMAVAVGIAKTYSGNLFLPGGPRCLQ